MTKPDWSGATFEDALCFRCGVKGETLYPVGPFAVAQCPKCRQAFISPRLANAERDKIYAEIGYFEEGLYGDRAGRAVKEIWEPARLRLIAERMAEDRRSTFDVRRSDERRNLLEIGCAYGSLLQQAQKLGFAVTGVEYSAAAVDWIRKNTNLNVHQGVVEAAGLPPGHFDAVCFYDVIEHVENPAAFLGTVTALAKPGGVISLSCPNFASLPARLFRSRWWTLRPQEHIWQFAPATLRRLLAEAGLEQIRILTSPLRRANLFRTDSMLALATRHNA